jgi:hypothetical protein
MTARPGVAGVWLRVWGLNQTPMHVAHRELGTRLAGCLLEARAAMAHGAILTLVLFFASRMSVPLAMAVPSGGTMQLPPRLRV